MVSRADPKLQLEPEQDMMVVEALVVKALGIVGTVALGPSTPARRQALGTDARSRP